MASKRAPVNHASSVLIANRPNLRIVPPLRKTPRLPEIPAVWRTLIDSWLAWLHSGYARPETEKLRDYQLRRLALDHADRHPWDLTTDDLATWMGAHSWGREAVRSYRSAFRSFYKWAHSTGQISHDPAALLRPVRPMDPQPRPAPDDTISGALVKADDRQWLILMLASRHGLRRAEIAQAHAKDIIEDLDGHSIIVHGKGGKLRTVPLLPAVAGHIGRMPHGWLFPNGHGDHLSPAHLAKLVRDLLDDCTLHQLRHRFATIAYQQTNDIRAVQMLLGHASLATTQRYVKPRDNALRLAVSSAA